MASNAEQYIIIDANIWIAYFDINDAQSKQAKKTITTLETNSSRILVSDFIIQEAASILLYKNKPEALQQFLNYIHNQPHIDIVSIDTKLWENTTKFIVQNNFTPKISFTDWSLLFLADEFNFHLLTFDKQLNSVYARLRKNRNY